MSTSRTTIRYYNNLQCKEDVIHLNTAQQYLAGQDENCHIKVKVEYERIVSTRLFKLEHSDGSWVIIRHGNEKLYINGLATIDNGNTKLHHNDIVICGPIWLIFEVSDGKSKEDVPKDILSTAMMQMFDMQGKINTAVDDLVNLKSTWNTLRDIISDIVENRNSGELRHIKCMKTFDLFPVRVDQIIGYLKNK